MFAAREKKCGKLCSRAFSRRALDKSGNFRVSLGVRLGLLPLRAPPSSPREVAELLPVAAGAATSVLSRMPCRGTSRSLHVTVSHGARVQLRERWAAGREI